MSTIEAPDAVKEMKTAILHTLTVTVAHKFNALARIIGLFSGRGYSIETISLGEGRDKNTARLTITTFGDQRIIAQIVHQLEKLVDVVEVSELTFESFVERELALIKVQSDIAKRSDITQVANIFGGKIVDISDETLTVEVTGGADKVNAAIQMMRPFGLREVARTGSVAMKREFESGARARIKI